MTHRPTTRKSPTFKQSVIQWREYHNHDETLKTDLGRWLAGFFYALALLADRKQQDYGPENLTNFGPKGIVVRMMDKANRLKNLYFPPGRQPTTKKPAVAESTLDTWGDWIVYESIGWLMEAGLWPPGNGSPPNTPILEIGMHDAKATAREAYRVGVDLLHQTRDAAAVMQRQYAMAGNLPECGKRYRSNRVPTVVECITVMPSYWQPGTVSIYVLFNYVHEPYTEMPMHLCCEPLFWFNDKFPMEVEA